MQNAIEPINYEQSVNAASESNYLEFARGYKDGKRRAISRVIRLLNRMELDYYDDDNIDSAKVCAHLRESIYDLSADEPNN